MNDEYLEKVNFTLIIHHIHKLCQKNDDSLLLTTSLASLIDVNFMYLHAREIHFLSQIPLSPLGWFVIK